MKKKWFALLVCMAVAVAALAAACGSSDTSDEDTTAETTVETEAETETAAETAAEAETEEETETVAVSEVTTITLSYFDAEEFADPDITYHPGVRWWWSGGAVDEETLTEQIDYLAENGFGYVEITPFYVSTILEGDEEAVASIYTEEFYELLDYAIGYCEEKGITVDINMGSGWNANSDEVTYDESMGNMALGRSTVTADEVLAGVEIPEAEISYFYTDEGAGEWQSDSVTLQGVLVGKLTGELGTDFVESEALFGTKPSYEEVYDEDGNVVKSYDTQVVLDEEGSFFISADDASIVDGQLVLSDEYAELIDEDAEYEIVAIYFVPSGGLAIDAAVEWYVVDHMDADDVIDYMNDWLSNQYLAAILESHDNIRALFNDSYEFYSDIYYTEDMIEVAADAENNVLGYDFTKYLATIYKQYSAAPYYMGLGTIDTYLTYTLDTDVADRITYDYNQLVNYFFLEGMAAFQSESNAVGLLYRQQAYNPPIDEMAAAEYVDIPESEQGDELSLIVVSSGAHLYGKNLVTAEQYTLGCVPLTNTLEEVKIGYDIMATSGINNFFYHGYAYAYGVDSEEYGEMGWSPFPSIGINVSALNTLSDYFSEMNDYAARVNYLMQLGSASADVAYYLEFNTDLEDTDCTTALNTLGIAWDTINDDSIVDEETTVVDGKISVNGGNMVYDAIVIETDTVPVETMEKLAELAAQGANIIFYGTTPDKQPSYADGDYEAQDALTAAAALECLDSGSILATSFDELSAALDEMTDLEVSYADNENVRFIRRELADGSQIVYIRNVGSEANTITVEVGDEFGDCYFLDQNTGLIYAAEKADDGTITFTMDASTDTYSGDYSMAIALLCEIEGESLSEDLLTEGLPACIDQTEATETIEVTIESLTVGDVTYTEDIIGLWNSDDFHDGELKYSDETGYYTGTVTLDAVEDGESVYLTLTEVYTAATITVNGVEVGDLMYNPWEIDITDYVTEGENTIEIAVTPRKYNAVNTDLTTEELVDTGFAGTATIEIR